MTLENNRLLLKMGDVERARNPQKTKNLAKTAIVTS